MIRKIMALFTRDLKVSLHDFIALYIIIFPVLFALVINWVAPGINDTTVNLAVLEGEGSERVAYLEDYAKIEYFDSIEAIERRVMKRDNIVGVKWDGDEAVLILQGNEPDGVADMAKTMLVFEYFGVSVEDTAGTITSLDRTIPPMKLMMVNIGIIFSSVLGGMLIALNIVEEKVDHTISAMHLTTLSRGMYIAGKSVIGIFVPVVGSVLLLIITGFGGVNYGQVLVILFTSSLISILVGFIEGLNNDDVINAAGNIKILFLPLFGAIAGYEVLADKWQKFFYWIPFYWTYRSNNLVLSKTGEWTQILMYSGFVVLISLVVFIVGIPKVKKGLQ